MAERPAPAAALRLDQTAAVVGGYRWIERRLFALTGQWAANGVSPRARLYLDEVSAQHAWHAELWADRLPVLDGIDPDALTVPPDPAVGALFQALAADGPAAGPGRAHATDAGTATDAAHASDAGTATDVGTAPDTAAPTVRALAGLCRVVLPRLLATYAEHRSRAVPVTDGPVLRALGLVTADELAAWQEGEALLQSLVTDARSAGWASDAAGGLEAGLAGSGIGAGLVRWPAAGRPGGRDT